MKPERTAERNAIDVLWRKISDALEGGALQLTEDERRASATILHSLSEERYHFIGEETLAQGGEKILTTAYDTHTDRTVVIARPIRRKTIEDKERFLREARLTCKLQHPNILPIYEIGLDKDNVPYFVMRRLDGEELGAVIGRRFEGNPEVSLDTLLDIFIKACDAIIYAHSLGVLHLDLKPANIMVGKFGEVVVFDWGLAHVMVEQRENVTSESFSPDELNSVNGIGTFCGTPGYMAPEQSRADGVESRATDVYSLGAILYKMLTGRLPVEGREPEEIRRNTRRGALLHPRARKSAFPVPSSLAAVAMKALAQEPADRYASIEQLRDDVIRFRRGYPPVAEKAGAVKKLQMLVRRHSRVATSVLGGAVIVLVLTMVWLVREKIHSAELTAARVEAETNLQNFLVQRSVSNHYYRELGGMALNSNFISLLYSYPFGYEFLVEENSKTDLSPEYRQKIRVALAWLEFARQKFNRAAELSRGGDSRIFTMASRWALIKPDDGAQLNDLQFARFMRSLGEYNNFRKLAPLSLQLHLEHRKSGPPEDYLPVVIEFLNLINNIPEWGSDLRLERRDGGYHLDLSNSPYHTFVMLGMKDYSYLNPLNLVSIDISGLELDGPFGAIVVGRVETVIMRDIQGPNIPEIARILLTSQFQRLRRLVVTRGMFDDEAVDALSRRFELVLEEPRSAGLNPDL